MFGMSTTELIIIVLIVLLLFGGKKIPELMKGLGQGVRSFKEGMNEVKQNLDTDVTDKTAKPDSASQNVQPEETQEKNKDTQEA